MNIQLSDHFTNRKLLRFTLPSIGMMIFSSIYGVVDGFFVSNFAGSTPFAAVNLIMPAWMIIATVGFMFGAGGTAIVSRTLGENDPERANRYFSLIIYFSAAVGALFSILGITFIRLISLFLGAEGELLHHCITYGRIIFASVPFFVLQLMFQTFFVVAEKPQLGFLTTILSGVTNIVLDAVLVMFLPQEYKLAGAAIATATGQVIGCMIPIVYFSRKNSSTLKLGKTRFEGKIIMEAGINGSSEFMTSVSSSFIGMLYNAQFLKYVGESGVVAYGVVMYVNMIFSATFNGYTVGCAPVIGFHYGAENHSELRSLLKKSLMNTGIMGVCMTVMAELFAAPLAGIFVGYDPAILEFTIKGLRIFALAFALMGMVSFSSGFFTALSDGVTSAAISFLRTSVFQSVSVLALPLILDIDGIWYSAVVAEGLAIVVAVLFLGVKQKKYHY